MTEAEEMSLLGSEPRIYVDGSL